MALLLYTSVESACAQKVRLVLSEKRLSWDEQSLNLRRGDQFSSEYLKLNPKAVVPTLIHDGRVIRESSIINEYLDEAFPEPRMKPEDIGLRSQMRLWVKTVDDEVHPAIGVLTYAIVLRQQMNEMKTPEELKQHFASLADPKRRERQQRTHELGLASPAVTSAMGNLKEIIRQIDNTLSDRPWLTGELYSLADASFAPYMVRLEALNLDDLWGKAPRFVDWLTRVKERANAKALENTWGSPGFLALVKESADHALPDTRALLATL